jgi:hypothetical protein
MLGCWLERRVQPYMTAIVLFVAMYSCLGHKEVRPSLKCHTVEGCMAQYMCLSNHAAGVGTTAGDPDSRDVLGSGCSLNCQLN